MEHHHFFTETSLFQRPSSIANGQLLAITRGIFSQYFGPWVLRLLQAQPASPKMGSSGAILSKQLPGEEMWTLHDDVDAPVMGLLWSFCTIEMDTNVVPMEQFQGFSFVLIFWIWQIARMDWTGQFAQRGNLWSQLHQFCQSRNQ